MGAIFSIEMGGIAIGRSIAVIGSGPIAAMGNKNPQGGSGRIDNGSPVPVVNSDLAVGAKAIAVRQYCADRIGDQIAPAIESVFLWHIDQPERNAAFNDAMIVRH